MSYCSPSVDISDHYTCFEYDELIQIANAFNKYINANKICPRRKHGVKNNDKNKDKNKDKNSRVSRKSSKTKRGGSKHTNSVTECIVEKPITVSGKDKRELWYSIYNRLKYICSYEHCWVDLDFVDGISDRDLRERIRWFTFKPKMTRTNNSWLGTQDINNVLQQYQELDTSFKFLGALPSDFYKVTRVDYNKVFDHKRIGMVFNLDGHKQPGSHWVAFLIDNVSKTLEYYDSAGKLPNRNIQTFIDTVNKYLQSHNYNYTQHYNTKKHQFKNSECGVYAIYFIIQRLLGFDFNYITDRVILDKQMNAFRKVIFRPRE